MRRVLSLSLFCLWSVTALAAHRADLAWMRGFVGHGSCCGTYDCTEATIVLLRMDADTAQVHVGEYAITLPASWVHPSQDAHGYWCFLAHQGTYVDAYGVRRGIPPPRPTQANTRCVFYQTLW